MLFGMCYVACYITGQAYHVTSYITVTHAHVTSYITQPTSLKVALKYQIYFIVGHMPYINRA